MADRRRGRRPGMGRRLGDVVPHAGSGAPPVVDPVDHGHRRASRRWRGTSPTPTAPSTSCSSRSRAGAVFLARRERPLFVVWVACGAVPFLLAAGVGAITPFFLDRTVTAAAWAPILAIGFLIDARGAALAGARAAVAVAGAVLVCLPGDAARSLGGTWFYDLTVERLARRGAARATPSPVAPAWYSPLTDWRLEVRSELGPDESHRGASIEDTATPHRLRRRSRHRADLARSEYGSVRAAARRATDRCGAALAPRRDRRAPCLEARSGIVRPDRRVSSANIRSIRGTARVPWGAVADTISNTIRIRGAREHNLRNVDLELPRDQLIVFTGLSGSGKSSLAFDTIYAEGQRRYVESLSAYARQFLGQMDKPDVDFIEGLSPAISIDQKSASRNPRSTVGTITEIYDYLRLLYARIGVPHCPNCGRVITRQTPAADRRPRAAARRGHPVPGAGAGRAGPQGRVRGPAQGARVAGLHPGPGRRRAGRARRGHRASAWPATRTTPSRSSSTAWCAARASSAGSPTRWRPRCASPRASPRSRSCRATTSPRRPRDAHVLGAPRVHALRGVVRRARAAQLLVQLAVRRVRALRRSRHALRGRPRARSSPTTT